MDFMARVQKRQTDYLNQTIRYSRNYWTLTELSGVLGIGSARLSTYVFKLPGFPARKVCGHWRIDKRKLSEWLKSDAAQEWLKRRETWGHSIDFNLEEDK